MKILIVCESADQYESGGRVVRYLTKILASRDNLKVKILVINKFRDYYNSDNFFLNNDVEFLDIDLAASKRIGYTLGYGVALSNYTRILQDFQPNVVHFASFDHKKPANFISIAKKQNARVILQPWTMHFYCEQGFGYVHDKKCQKCVKGNFLNALKEGCAGPRGIPRLIERTKLKKVAPQADIVLSSNEELDEILLSYGFPKQRILRFPVPFDYSFISPPIVEDGDYAIYFGQPNDHKGIDVLRKVFNSKKEIKLRVYPMVDLPNSLFEAANVQVVTGLNWRNGLSEALSKAKIAVLPTRWSTSTEYTLCEAILFKKPVVLFNTGVHRHYFSHKFNAMLLDSDDIEGYGDAIEELMSNDALRKKIADNAYDTLIDVNHPDVVYKKLMEAYNG